MSTIINLFHDPDPNIYSKYTTIVIIANDKIVISHTMTDYLKWNLVDYVANHILEDNITYKWSEGYSMTYHNKEISLTLNGTQINLCEEESAIFISKCKEALALAKL